MQGSNSWSKMWTSPSRLQACAVITTRASVCATSGTAALIALLDRHWATRQPITAPHSSGTVHRADARMGRGGLRGEVAMAKKFRSRSMAERVSFIQRQPAPFMKAMQKEREHTKSTARAQSTGAPHQNGAAPDISHGAEAAAAAVALGRAASAILIHPRPLLLE